MCSLCDRRSIAMHKFARAPPSKLNQEESKSPGRHGKPRQRSKRAGRASPRWKRRRRAAHARLGRPPRVEAPPLLRRQLLRHAFSPYQRPALEPPMRRRRTRHRPGAHVAQRSSVWRSMSSPQRHAGASSSAQRRCSEMTDGPVLAPACSSIAALPRTPRPRKRLPAEPAGPHRSRTPRDALVQELKRRRLGYRG